MNIMKMMKQAQQLQANMVAAQEKLSEQTVTVEGASGKVKVTATCAGIVTDLQIDPSIIDPSDAEFLQDLVMKTVNDALLKGKQTSEEEIKKITGGLNLPPGLGF